MLIIFLGNKLCSFIPLIVLRATDLKQDKVLGPYQYKIKHKIIIYMVKKLYLHLFDRIGPQAWNASNYQGLLVIHIEHKVDYLLGK